MSNRLIFQALNDLARQLELLSQERSDGAVEGGDSADADKQIKRLSRELFKANTLVEAQAEQTQNALATMQTALNDLYEHQEDAIQQARLDVIKALLPVVDSIEEGLKSGARQVKAMLDTTPDAARTLASWLKGQQLLRDRMLKVFEAEGVTPIPAVGQPFDPYQHVAVNAVYDPDRENGLVLAEERRGYQCGEVVLRYADVIVNRHPER